MSSSQLTKSIIFQRGRAQPPSRYHLHYNLHYNPHEIPIKQPPGIEIPHGIQEKTIFPRKIHPFPRFHQDKPTKISPGPSWKRPRPQRRRSQAVATASQNVPPISTRHLVFSAEMGQLKKPRYVWDYMGLYQWPFEEPIDWRYLPYIRPMFTAYVSRNIPTKYGLKYGTNVPPSVGSWNSHLLYEIIWVYMDILWNYIRYYMHIIWIFYGITMNYMGLYGEKRLD